jgi:hypothetical protein
VAITERVLPFECLLRTDIGAGHLQRVEWQPRVTSAAFCRLLKGVLIGQEVLQRGEQKRAEVTARRFSLGHRVVPQQRLEERLRQILGLREAVTSAPDVSQHWRTVKPAQFLQRMLRLTGRSPRVQHQAPACGLEQGHADTSLTQTRLTGRNGQLVTFGN